MRPDIGTHVIPCREPAVYILDVSHGVDGTVGCHIAVIEGDVTAAFLTDGGVLRTGLDFQRDVLDSETAPGDEHTFLVACLLEHQLRRTHIVGFGDFQAFIVHADARLVSAGVHRDVAVNDQLQLGDGVVLRGL